MIIRTVSIMVALASVVVNANELHMRTLQLLNNVSTSKKKTLIKILQQDYPELKVNTLRFYDQGGNNIVFEVNDTLLFRFSVKRKASQFLLKEINILDYLKNKITAVQIPEIKYTGKKYFYMGYEKIKGETFNTHFCYLQLSQDQRNKIIQQLAAFLYELHTALPAAKGREFGIKEVSVLDTIHKIATRLEKVKNIDKNIVKLAYHVENLCKKIKPQEHEITVIHGDLHKRNMAFDPVTKKITGIFDFDQLQINDIHKDFRSFYKLRPYNRDFFATLAQAYEKLSGRKLDRWRIALYALVEELNHVLDITDQTPEKLKKRFYTSIAILVKDLGIQIPVTV